MDFSIVSKDAIWRAYQEARISLDPLAAVQHVAGITGADLVDVECVVQSRDTEYSAMEQAAC